MKFVYIVFLIVVVKIFVVSAGIDFNQLKCLVCQATMEEMDHEISKVDPNKMVEVGGYRLDPSGDTKVRTLPQIKSEVFLSELLEKVCDTMDDYVRATWKTNGQLTLLKMIDKDGKMNADMSRVDIIQDGDLNKSLKYYCQGIVDDFEEEIIKHYKNGSDNMDIRVCSVEAKLCSHTLPEEDDGGFDDEL